MKNKCTHEGVAAHGLKKKTNKQLTRDKKDTRSLLEMSIFFLAYYAYYITCTSLFSELIALIYPDEIICGKHEEQR